MTASSFNLLEWRAPRGCSHIGQYIRSSRILKWQSLNYVCPSVRLFLRMRTGVCWRATSLVLITQTISVLDDIVSLPPSPPPSPSSHHKSTTGLSHIVRRRCRILIVFGGDGRRQYFCAAPGAGGAGSNYARNSDGRSVGTARPPPSRYRCPIIASLTANWSISRPESYPAVTSSTARPWMCDVTCFHYALHTMCFGSGQIL